MSSQSDQHIFAGAQNTNAAHAKFISAGGDVTIIQVDHDEKILATLMPVERGGHIHGCMKGTRKDVLSTVNDWLNDFTIDTPNILLLSGGPGAGKSTIAASVVSDLDRRKRLGSSLAFKHSEASLSDPTAVWRTVASDLARFHPSVKDSLVEILGRVEPGRADIDLQFRRLIEEPLTQNVERLSHNPVVVLDALDECGSDRSLSGQRRQLLDTLRKWGNLPRAFKLIVTSRDERLPGSFRQACRHVVLETGSHVTSMASDDIRLFLRTRFGEISERYDWPSTWPGESMIEKLTRRAAGLFIWAETLVCFVDNGKCFPKHQLDLVLQGDFGKEGDAVNGLYRRILDVSFEDSDPRVVDAFLAIVGTIVLAKVPISRADVASFLILPVEESDIDFILDKLSSVISIGKTDRMIHVCHLSFADFICDTTGYPKYAIDRAIHSRNLALACFQMMKSGLKFNICGLETSDLLNDQVQDLPARIKKSIPTRLAYACRFGLQHLQDTPQGGSSGVELLNDVSRFLRVQFLYWLEVMSLIKEVPSAMTTLFAVVQRLSVSISGFFEVVSRGLSHGPADFRSRSSGICSRCRKVRYEFFGSNLNECSTYILVCITMVAAEVEDCTAFPA
jgi:hypothetical protein